MTAPTTALTPFVPSSLEDAWRLSEQLAKSQLLPAELKGKPADIFTTLICGHELGLSPMQAIRAIHVVKGKPVLSADLMVALVKRRGDVCRYFRLVVSDDERAEYETHREGDPEPTRMAYTMVQARGAGLAASPTYKAHPAAMLRARCMAALARAVYPDLVLGVDETSEGEEIRGRDVIDVPAGVAPPPAGPPPVPVRAVEDAAIDVVAEPADNDRSVASILADELGEIEESLDRARLDAFPARVQEAKRAGRLSDEDLATLRAIYTKLREHWERAAEPAQEVAS